LVSDAFLATLKAATERYEARSADREQTMRRLAEVGVLGADDAERVDRRLRRLNCSWSLARALEETPAVATSGRSLDALEPETFGADVLGLERLMGRNDMIDVGFLERGWLASRSVGRITIRSGDETGGYGTGFLVSPRLLLTNNHVLRSVEEAAGSYVEFNYQSGLDGMPLTPVAFPLEPEGLFVTSRELDFSLVAVRSRGQGGEALGDFGHLRLIEQEGKVILGELVNIVQHPNGEPKQLALRENKLVDLLELFLQYQTDTSPGSSGSPVFNDQWEVVALHHSGVPKTDASGAWLALDGSRWTPEQGEAQIDWKANEGVRISRVLAAVRQAPLSGAAGELRSELLAAASVPVEATGLPPTIGSAALGSAGAGLAGFAPGSGAVAEFIIPVTVGVSVSAGAPVPASGPIVSPGQAPPAVAASGGGGAGVDRAMLASGLASLEANRDRPYYEAQGDAQARERYYAAIDPNADPAQLTGSLAALLEQTHRPQPRYRPSDLVYPWVDLHPDGKLRSIYSGKTFEPEELIRADARIEARRTERLQEFGARESASGAAMLTAEAAALEAAHPFNCEHVVPQSTFAEREPMRGDLHHLFACESNCNSFRGNTPYFDFPDFEEALRHDCGRREEARFEPSNGKGAVARATLYFLLRYPGVVGDQARELQADRLPILLDWHHREAVSEWERHRNAAISELQGNRNPLIDHPEWAQHIPFQSAFGR